MRPVVPAAILSLLISSLLAIPVSVCRDLMRIGGGPACHERSENLSLECASEPASTAAGRCGSLCGVQGGDRSIVLTKGPWTEVRSDWVQTPLQKGAMTSQQSQSSFRQPEKVIFSSVARSIPRAGVRLLRLKTLLLI